MSAIRSSASEVGRFAQTAEPDVRNSPSHAVQFYSQDSSLLDELGRVIGGALGDANAVVVIATKQHREGLEQRLVCQGLDVAAVFDRGRYLSLDAATTLSQFLVNDRPNAEVFTALIGDILTRAQAAVGSQHRVVVFGEMVALLWCEGKLEAAIQLEQLWNTLALTYNFSLRCAYPIANFHLEQHSDLFLQVCGAHSSVIPADSYTQLATDRERLNNIAQLQHKEQLYVTLSRTKKELERQIAEKIEVEKKLRESERSLRELSGRLLRMQDEERRHLGRELHDSVGQYLASLKMRLDLMKGDLESTALPESISECIRLVNQSISEVRTMSYLLYPPMLEEMGLETAIPWYLDGFAKRSGIATSFDISGHLGRLPRDVELAIFRVIQESLTNVLRHSGSATAQVRLSIENHIAKVEIRDQGKGIPTALLHSAGEAIGTLGVGLRGMSERMRQLGGRLEMLSSEAGTSIIASVRCDVSSGSQTLGEREHVSADSDRR